MKKGTSGGVSFRFAVGTNGAAAAHVRYITREAATESRLDRIYLHNLVGSRGEREGYRAVRSRLIVHAREREKFELEKRVQGGRTPYSFYRAIIGFESEVEPQKALAMVKEFLTENFPLARAVAAFHSDTDHGHVHLHVQARMANNRKVHFSPAEFRRLDEKWGRIYAREFGEEKLAQHLAKKAEMAEANRAYFAGMDAIGKRGGLSAGERENLGRDFKGNFAWPERVDYRQTRERIREREARKNDERGTGIRERQTPDRGNREGRADRALERATRGAGEALRGLERATERSREISDRGQRLYSRERERDRGR